jgi:GGDEF domain-containing protein/2'-5' RNA ligase
MANGTVNFSDIDEFMQSQQSSSAKTDFSDIEDFMSQEQAATASSPAQRHATSQSAGPATGTISAYKPSFGERITGGVRRAIEDLKEGRIPFTEMPVPGAQTAGHVADVLTPVSDISINDPRSRNPEYIGQKQAEAIGDVVKDVTGARGYPQMYKAGKKYVGTFTHPEQYKSIEDENRARVEAGSELISGATEAATPLLGVGLATAPVRTAIGMGTGLVTGKVAEKGAEYAGLSPEWQNLLGEAGFFLPSVLGAVSGIRSVAGEGKTAGQGEVKFAGIGRKGTGYAGVGESEGAWHARVNLGGKEYAVDIAKPGASKETALAPTDITPQSAAGTGPVPPPPAPSMSPANQAREQQVNDAAMVSAAQQATERAAGQQVMGSTPQPEAPPDPTADMAAQGAPTGGLSAKTVDVIAQVIAQAPEDVRPQLILEAHQNLTNWLTAQGRLVGPDGRVYTVKSLEQAEALATKWINEQVESATKPQDATPAKVVGNPVQAPQPSATEQASTTVGPVSQEMPPQPAASEPKNAPSYQKGQEVRFVDNQGVERTGVIRYAGDMAVRLDVGGKKYEVAPSKIRGVAAPEVPDSTSSFRTGNERRNQSVPAREERRNGIDRRDEKFVSEMTPDERERALLTQEITGLPNGRAFKEAERKSPAPAIGYSDMDGLGAVNDHFGHDAGDQLLIAKSEALQDAGIDAYHLHGDEFAHRSDNADALKERFEKAREDLRSREFELVGKDGKSYIVSGVDFSYGIGPDQASADRALLAHKEQRTAAGERAPKGKLGGSIKVSERLHQELPATSKEEPGGEGEGGSGSPPLTSGTPPQTPPSPEISSAAEQPTKYKYGNTQANIPAESEASKAIEATRTQIADADLAGDGKDIGGNHITVRYGIDGDDVEGIRAFLEAQAPFEARLGKTEKFEPSKSSDGAAVIQAPVEAPELHRLNTELAKHGNFIEPTFPEYKPHTTIAYVKPEVADKYVGMDATDGKTFAVDEIAISKRDGSQEVVKLKGRADSGDQKIAPLEKNSEVIKKSASESELPGRPAESVRMIDPNLLKADPKRFQWRVVPRNAIPESAAWDQAKAGPVDIWRDPADGQWYVVEGHHRYRHAIRKGAAEVETRVHEFPSAEYARQWGARRNIELGNAEPFDAALYLRETHTTPDELREQGMNLNGELARKGIALSRLSEPLWEQYRNGELGESKAVAIGENLSDPAQQMAMARLAQRRNLGAKELEQLARRIQERGNTVSQVGTLFGNQPFAESNAIEEAKFAVRVEKELQTDRKALNFVANAPEARKAALARGENVINVEKSSEQAMIANALADGFRRLQNRTGKVYDLLADAGKRLTAKEKPDVVFRQIYPQIREAILHEIGGDVGGRKSLDQEGIRRGTQGRPAESEEQSPARSASEDEGPVEPEGGSSAHHLFSETENDLSPWATSRSLIIQDAPAQESLFGEPERMFYLQRTVDGKPDRIMVSESQLQRLAEQHPNVQEKMNDLNQGSLYSKGGQEGRIGEPDRVRAEIAGEPGKASDAVKVQLSRSAANLIQQIRGDKKMLGVNRSRVAAFGDSLLLRKYAQESELPQEIKDDILGAAAVIGEAAKRAGKAGVSFVVEERVAPEEMFHGAQRYYGEEKIESHIPDEVIQRLITSETGQRLAGYLREHGYNDVSDAMMVAEIAAKLATKDAGLLSAAEPHEVIGFVRDYLAAIDKQHGPSAATDLVERITNEDLGHAAEEWRKQYGEETTATIDAGPESTRGGEGTGGSVRGQPGQKPGRTDRGDGGTPETKADGEGIEPGEVSGSAIQKYRVRDDVIPGTTTAEVDWLETEAGPGSLGTAVMRQTLRNFFNAHPEIDNIGGLRIGGKRAGRYIVIDRDLKHREIDLDTISSLDDESAFAIEQPEAKQTGLKLKPSGTPGSVNIERTRGRDYHFLDRFQTPLSLLDFRGRYEKIGGLLGKAASDAIRNAKHDIEQMMHGWGQALDTVFEFSERDRKTRKVSRKQYDDEFITLIEKNFDDPTRKGSTPDQQKALEAHDALTEKFRQYIIDTRRGLGIEMPDNWGITEKGYFRHLFLGDIRLFMDGNFIGTAQTYAEAQKRAADILKEKPDAQITARAREMYAGDPTLRVSTGKYERIVNELQRDVDISRDDLVEDLRGIVGKNKNRQKFFGALLERKGAGGYQRDYRKVMELHAAQVARTQELTKLNRTIQPIIEMIRAKGQSGLADAMQRHLDALWGTPTKWEQDFGRLLQSIPALGDRVANPALALRATAARLTSIQSLLKLRYNIRASLVNLLDPQRTLWPYTTTSEFASLYANYAQPSTRQMLRDRGVIQGTTKLEGDQTVAGHVRRDPFTRASQVNRAMGYLHGIRLAEQQGLTGEAAHRMGMDWADKVEFDNSVWNAPEILRGPAGKVFGQFKGYSIKTWENLFNLLRKRQGEGHGARFKRLGKWGAGQAVTGGISGFGFKLLGGYLIVKGLAEALKHYGMHEDEARKTAEAVYYGSPAIIGTDLSSSVSLIDAPYGNSTWEQVGSFSVGPTISMGVNVFDKVRKADETADYLSLARSVTPYTKTGEALYGLATKGHGSVKAGRRRMQLTPFETVMLTLGFTPLKQTRYYDMRDAKRARNKGHSRTFGQSIGR